MDAFLSANTTDRAPDGHLRQRSGGTGRTVRLRMGGRLQREMLLSDAQHASARRETVHPPAVQEVLAFTGN